jgi:hypothetical protein
VLNHTYIILRLSSYGFFSVIEGEYDCQGCRCNSGIYVFAGGPVMCGSTVSAVLSGRRMGDYVQEGFQRWGWYYW